MVVGDPAGMRDAADRLAKYADRLRDFPSRYTKAFGKADMSGPWADNIEIVLKARVKGFASAADRLDAAAKALRTSATQVQAAIDAERRREELAAAAAEAARREAAAKAEAARRAGK